MGMGTQLATQLIKEGKKDKALKVLDYCSEVIPSTTVPHDYIMSSSKEMGSIVLSIRWEFVNIVLMRRKVFS